VVDLAAGMNPRIRAGLGRWARELNEEGADLRRPTVAWFIPGD